MIDLEATVLEEEWKIDDRQDLGCGNFIFKFSDSTILVVEAKSIHYEYPGDGSNKTKRAMRTNRRQKVVKQAIYYLKYYCKNFPYATDVRCATFTDEEGLVIIACLASVLK